MKFLKQILKWTGKAAIIVCSGTFLALFTLIFMLYRGPVDLDIAKPYLKKTPLISQYLQNFDHLTLIYDKDTTRFVLTTTGMSLSFPSNIIDQAYLQNAELEIDPLSILKRDGIARKLKADGLKIHIQRENLSTESIESLIDLNQNELENFFTEIVYFEEVVIKDTQIIFGKGDTHKTFSFDLAGSRLKEDFSGQIKIKEIHLQDLTPEVATPDRFEPSRMSLSGKIETTESLNHIHFKGKIINLSSVLLDKLCPQLIPDNFFFALEDVRLDYQIDRSNRFHQAKLISQRSKIDFMTKTQHLFQFKDAGLVAELQGSYFVINLENLSYQNLKFPLSIHGRLDDKKHRIYLKLSSRIDLLPANRISTLWPRDLVEDARLWIDQNIHAGDIKNLKFQSNLCLDYSGEKNILKIKDLECTFDVQNLDLSYLNSLPRVTNLNANARLKPDGIKFSSVTGASNTLKLTDGLLTINWGDNAPILSLNVNTMGSAQKALEIIDSKPLNYLHTSGFSPSDTAGHHTGTLTMKFSLDHELLEGLEATFDGKVTDFSIQNLIGTHHGLAKATFSTHYDRHSGVKLSGAGEFMGVRSAFDYVCDQTGKTSITLSGVIDTKKHTHESFNSLKQFVEGAVPFKITLKDNASKDMRANFSALLEEASVNTLFYLKPPGEKAELSGEITFKNHAFFSAENLRLLTHSHHDLHASISRDSNNLLLGKITAGTLEKTLATLKFKEKTPQLFIIDVKGQNVQLDGLMDLKDNMSYDPGISYRLRLNADTLSFGGKHQFANAYSTIECHHGVMRDLLMTGHIKGLAASHSQLKLLLKSDDSDKRTLKLVTNSAGETLSALKLHDGLIGGSMYISLVDDPEFKMEDWEGKIQIKDFVLREAPLATKVFAVIFPTGISSLTKDGGMKFNDLKAKFGVSKEKITLHGLRTWCSSTGFSISGFIERKPFGRLKLNGAMIPAYAMNTLISRIPVIGTILTGGRDDGLLATHFKVKGETINPVIETNPLSTITPGILKGLFSNHASGSAFEDPWMDSDPESERAFQDEFVDLKVF